MKKVHSLLIIIAFLPIICKAQLFPKLGAERAGISALTFLKMDVSPRAEAMAGAQVSSIGDAYACGWNPAAMTELKSTSVSLSDKLLQAGISNSYLSGIFKAKNNNFIGASLTFLNSGAIEKRTVYQPDGTGQFIYASDMALGLSYAKILSEYFSLGVSARYVREQLAEFSANTVAIDLGFLYKTGYKDLRFAVVLQGFGPNSTLSGNFPTINFGNPANLTTGTQPASGVFKIGISFIPYKTTTSSLSVEAQLSHPNDNAENIAVGLEYTLHKVLMLRAGYRVNVKDQNYPTAGIGLKSHVGRHPMTIDYGVNTGQFLGFTHTIGISFSINKENRGSTDETTPAK